VRRLILVTSLIALFSVLPTTAEARVEVLHVRKLDCIQAGIKVGVRYDSSTGGPTWFRVSIFRQATGHLVWTRHGNATVQWRKWYYSVPFEPPYTRRYIVRYTASWGTERFRVLRYGCE
jgi:hypothetical protein